MKQTWLNKNNWKYRLTQLVILILHLVLLKWILYTLSEGGRMSFQVILGHFVGISAFGAALIRFCAFYYQKRYEDENSLESH